ncbi:MAG: hypothetical protein J5679_01060 [Alphaproteobacteria bacterium]|nr:hypothetical protein [Alphaproteobacteria bacterium]
MQKKLIISLSAIMMATSANAGLLDFLGLGQKEAEPTTLAEACNKDEVSKFCPEVLLGEKTIPTCLVDNVKSVSKKCAKFVKKSIKEQAASIKDQAAAVKTEANNAVKEKADVVAEKKAAAKATADEIKAAAKQVEADAKETGAAFKEMFKPEVQ